MELDPDLGALLILGMALLLVTAFWQKQRHLPDFQAVLEAYQLVPRALVPLIARVLPAGELGLALALLWPPMRSVAALTVAALMLTYASAIAINLRRGRLDLDCGCAGASDRRPIAGWMVVRNLLLAAGIATASLPWSSRALEPVDALTVAGGLVIAVLVYLASDQLLGQVMPRGAALRRPS
jgi:Methylamine utilisation protein MauE